VSDFFAKIAPQLNHRCGERRRPTHWAGRV